MTHHGGELKFKIGLFLRLSSIFVCSLVVAHWAGSRPHIINTPEDKEEYLLAILVDAHGGPGIIAVESSKGIVLGQVEVDRALERCIARGLLVLPQCTMQYKCSYNAQS